MSTTYDVIVVGAGPGGSSAAHDLARAGLKTLLLEKEKMPRYKPCGGGLTEKVTRILNLDFAPTIEATITGASVAFGTERLRLGFGQPVAWCVMRDKFDLFLAQRAANAGAEVRDDQPVTGIEFDAEGARVTTRGETLRAAIVVGADGVNGLVRRAGRFPAYQRLGIALEAEMEAPAATLETWHTALHIDFGALPWGYAWIFPKSEHLSVGVGALWRRGHPLDLRADLAHYLETEPYLKGARVLFTRGHRVPLGGQFGTYHTRRALLVGDAAGIVDPFTAEGIYYALRSGQIAAQEITRACERGDPDLARYTRRINAEINSDFRFAWMLTNVFYRWPRLSYGAFKRSQSIQHAAAEMVVGSQSYVQMAGDIVKRVVAG